MKKQIQTILIALLFFNGLIFGQNVQLEGYIFEDNNRGFLNEVMVDIYEATNETFITKSTTNTDGLFIAELPAGKDYILKVRKDLFFPKEEMVSTKGKNAGQKVYTKIKLERKPGYIFDVTLAEKGAPKATVNAITGARVEVYNNTTEKEVLVEDSLAGINFDVTFERGNHYTVLIRKEGFFNKRLEAYVDIEGCILCFEGVGTVTPGVSDVMSEGFQMGSVLANIELEPARLNRTMEIENIYYDLGKYNIRADAAIELEKVVKLLKDNPAIIIELGSHTDARGGNRTNMTLSSNRAKAAVEYIVKNGNVDQGRITAKGYGETKLVNKCVDGVKCSEAEHQKNRRTELKIVGFEDFDPLENRSLADILIEEKLLNEVLNFEQVQVGAGEVPDFDKLESKANQKKSAVTKKATANKSTKTATKAKKTTKETAKSGATTSVKASTNKSTETGAKVIKTAKETAKSGATTSVKANTNKSTKTATKVEKTAKETAKSGATTSVKTTSKKQAIEKSTPSMGNSTARFLDFKEEDVLIIKNGTIQLIAKTIDNQLNMELINLLAGKKINVQQDNIITTYQFDKQEDIPMGILNVFLSKVAMMEQANSWRLFPLKEGVELPNALLQALK